MTLSPLHLIANAPQVENTFDQSNAHQERPVKRRLFALDAVEEAIAPVAPLHEQQGPQELQLPSETDRIHQLEPVQLQVEETTASDIQRTPEKSIPVSSPMGTPSNVVIVSPSLRQALERLMPFLPTSWQSDAGQDDFHTMLTFARDSHLVVGGSFALLLHELENSALCQEGSRVPGDLDFWQEKDAPSFHQTTLRDNNLQSDGCPGDAHLRLTRGLVEADILRNRHPNGNRDLDVPALAEGTVNVRGIEVLKPQVLRHLLLKRLESSSETVSPAIVHQWQQDVARIERISDV